MKITGWEAAQVLTLEGFLRWCEGKPLCLEDFKNQIPMKGEITWLMKQS